MATAAVRLSVSSLTEPTQLVPVANATPILCNGESSTVTVTASGGTPPYSGTGTFTRTAGTHTFTVTDSYNCTETVTVTILEPAVLAVDAVATPILCYGDNSTVTVSATGGTPPYYGTGSFSESAGSYTYVVTDANGCTDSASVTITEPTEMIVDATATDILCPGDNSTVTVTATGGTPPYTGVGTFSRPAGIHTFTVTDDNGCTETVSLTITEPPLFIAFASPTTLLCHGDSATVTVTATGGTPPYTGTGTFKRQAGTHTFTVVDDNSCTTSITITIDEPPALVVTATSPRLPVSARSRLSPSLHRAGHPSTAVSGRSFDRPGHIYSR
jgi:hypothetical protein